jgi:cytochrome c oxidase subunit 3
MPTETPQTIPLESQPPTHEQYVDMDQQRTTAEAGMWVFLATEILFFGGLFTGYTAYHHLYTQAFNLAARKTDLLLGSLNTAVLLTSSLTMALAVHAAKTGRRRELMGFLITTIILGCAFLAFKGWEYSDHIKDHLLPGPGFVFPEAVPLTNQAQVFFYLYFAMTGLHAIHMTAGVLLLSVILFFAWRGKFTPYYHTPVINSALYWHFVDLVWIFLFPMFYLFGGRG